MESPSFKRNAKINATMMMDRIALRKIIRSMMNSLIFRILVRMSILLGIVKVV